MLKAIFAKITVAARKIAAIAVAAKNIITAEAIKTTGIPVVRVAPVVVRLRGILNAILAPRRFAVAATVAVLVASAGQIEAHNAGGRHCVELLTKNNHNRFFRNKCSHSIMVHFCTGAQRCKYDGATLMGPGSTHITSVKIDEKIHYGACLFEGGVFLVQTADYNSYRCRHQHPNVENRREESNSSGRSESRRGESGGSGGSRAGPNSCKYANDGECDEPSVCPRGTDTNDCSGRSGGGSGSSGSGSSGSGSSGSGSSGGEWNTTSGCYPYESQEDCEKRKAILDLSGALLGGIFGGGSSSPTPSTPQPQPRPRVDPCDALIAKTPDLQSAAKGNRVNAARCLIQNGADVNAKDDDGNTVLSWASYYNAPEVAEILINHGADVNAKNEKYLAPLHWAAQKNAHEVAEILINHGAYVNAKNKRYGTPLHEAVWDNALRTAKFLVQNGADVNAQQNDGATPLHIAAQRNAREIAEFLLQNGAEVNAKRHNGWTPLDWAIIGNVTEMQSLLRRHGGHCNTGC